MKKSVASAIGIMSLYLLNRFWLIPHSGGLVHRVLSWWFADFLAGGMMIALLFAALHLAHRKPPKPLPVLRLRWHVVYSGNMSPLCTCPGR